MTPQKRQQRPRQQRQRQQPFQKEFEGEIQVAEVSDARLIKDMGLYVFGSDFNHVIRLSDYINLRISAFMISSAVPIHYQNPDAKAESK